jgi:hypothetical protein
LAGGAPRRLRAERSGFHDAMPQARFPEQSRGKKRAQADGA